MQSCYDIIGRVPSARTGQYVIWSADVGSMSSSVVYCEMETLSGGWTAVFVDDSAKCSQIMPRTRPDAPTWQEPVERRESYYTECVRDNQLYTLPSFVSAQPTHTDKEVMLGFIDTTGAILGSDHASFHIPWRWITASPMSYRRQHTTVVNATVAGQIAGDVKLVYGHSKMLWDSCDYDGMATEASNELDGAVKVGSQFAGQICLVADGSPWWTNFAVGEEWGHTQSNERDQGFCTSGVSGSWDETRCSAERRFAIFVREVDCSAASAERCAGLNRDPCYSTAGTCGRCLYGYNGTAGDRNEPCLCTCLNGGRCLAETDDRRYVDGVRHVCHCANLFSGLLCENDPCESPAHVECGDHGSCVEGRCACRERYSGDRCEVRPPDPLCFGRYYLVPDSSELSASAGQGIEGRPNYDPRAPATLRCDSAQGGGPFALGLSERGWYRLPAGRSIPTTFPGELHCGTEATSWLSGWRGPHVTGVSDAGDGGPGLNFEVPGESPSPDVGAPPSEATVCFGASRNATCASHAAVRVVNCGDFELWELPTVTACPAGYCIE